MKVSKEQVEKALADLGDQLSEEALSKASENDLDQPEGDDMGEGESARGKKMSDESVKPGKAEKSMKMKKHEDEEEGEEEHEKKEGGPAMKAKKAYMDSDHEDEAEEHSEHHGEPSGKPSKSVKAKKSFAEELPEEVQTKVEVSEFLKSLVDHTGACIDELRGEVAKSENQHERRYEDLTSAIDDVQQSQAKIGIVLKAVCERIGIVESAPARAKKSDTVAKSAPTAPERKFASGLEGDDEEPVFKGLNTNPIIAKSQISEVLCDLVKKGDAQDLDVIGFETNGFIRPELMPKLREKFN